MHAKLVALLLFLLNSVELCARDHPMLSMLSTTCPCDLTMAGLCFWEGTHPLYPPRQRIESGENLLTSGLVHFDIYARFK